MGGRAKVSELPWSRMSWGAIPLLLLIPLVAMQLTNEVIWTAADFAVAAGLLAGALGLYQFATRRRSRGQRAMVGAGVLVVLLAVWAQGAVGLF